jgi:putative membrane protein
MDNFLSTWGTFGLGWLLIILFWIIVILGIITLIRWLAGYGKESRRNRDRERDIDREKYREDMDRYGYSRIGRERNEEQYHYPWRGEKRSRDFETRKFDRDYLGIIKERYARGEITKEQFDQIRKDLEV